MMFRFFFFFFVIPYLVLGTLLSTAEATDNDGGVRIRTSRRTEKLSKKKEKRKSIKADERAKQQQQQQQQQQQAQAKQHAAEKQLQKAQKHAAENYRLQQQQELWHRHLSSSNLQPKVTAVEQSTTNATGGGQQPTPTRSMGTISMPPGGSNKWCGKGQTTYWVVGHQQPEHPWCKEANGIKWTNTSLAVLDYKDSVNNIDLPNKNIDRHDCVHLDVNGDNSEDIVCLVGAKKGHGNGYNELYLTRGDGSLFKVKHHGLQKYPTLSSRVAIKLKHASTGSTLIFVGVFKKKRTDGQINSNRMFRHHSKKAPFFKEHPGPWTKWNDVLTATVADVNADGTDDIITIGRKTTPRMYIQNTKGQFSEVLIPRNRFVKQEGWRNARVGYVTKGKRPDLVTVEGFGNDRSYVRIYQGIDNSPYFNFDKPYFTKRLPNAAPGVEILDVDQDGWKDIYVTQANETSGYCAAWGDDVNKYWPDGKKPSQQWVPPIDTARDLLFMGGYNKADGKQTFRSIPMSFLGNGCGWWAWRFMNERTLILSYGRIIHAGYNYLLEWSPIVETEEAST